MARILLLLMVIYVLISCNKTKQIEFNTESIDCNSIPIFDSLDCDSIPVINSYLDHEIDYRYSIVTDTFMFEYEKNNYCLAVVRDDCKSGCGMIYLFVYEINNGCYMSTQKLFPKKESYSPNGCLGFGAFVLSRHVANLDDVKTFTEQIDFNPITRIISYDEVFEDEYGTTTPTGKKISWELKEYL